MPVTFSGGFGSLDRPAGNFVFRQDPLQQQIEQAKLNALLAEPQLEQRRLQLEGQDRERMLEALRSQEGIESAKLGEEREFHQGTLGVEREKLAASKEEREQTSKTDLADALITHLSPLEATGQITKGTLARSLTGLGFPQLEQSGIAMGAEDLQNRARALVPSLTAAKKAGSKTFDAFTKSLDPDLVKAASRFLPQDEEATATPSAVSLPLATRIGSGVRSLSGILGQSEPGMISRLLAGKDTEVNERLKQIPSIWKQFYAGLTNQQGGSNVVSQ